MIFQECMNSIYEKKFRVLERQEKVHLERCLNTQALDLAILIPSLSWPHIKCNLQ